MNYMEKRKREEELCQERWSFDLASLPDPEEFKHLDEVLDRVGVYIFMDEKRLHICLLPRYMDATRQTSGRRRKRAVCGDSLVRFSDVVLMMGKKIKDAEIAEAVGLPIATYRRHKKTMLESDYYKGLDPERIGEEEYLKSVPGDRAF